MKTITLEDEDVERLKTMLDLMIGDWDFSGDNYEYQDLLNRILKQLE